MRVLALAGLWSIPRRTGETQQGIARRPSFRSPALRAARAPPQGTAKGAVNRQ
jgi:hypothetical protein